MTPKQRTYLVVGAPLVAVATLMIGLRIGAGSGFRAALVYGAPHAEIEKQDDRFAYQIVTYFEDRGVREAIAMKGLEARAISTDGKQLAKWVTSSNEDGVAEMLFSLPHGTTEFILEVRTKDERDPLAVGRIHLQDEPRRAPLPPPAEREAMARVRPSKREGDLLMDVYVQGGRLVVGSPNDLWVYVHPKVPRGATEDETRRNEGLYLTRTPEPAPSTIKATPEIGVSFGTDQAKASCWGNAKLEATALGQAASTLLEATGPNGEKGVWFGTLPTAPGAFSVRMPPLFYLDETKPEAREAIVVAPNPRKFVYAEIDTIAGSRIWAGALPLVVEPLDPLPRAHVPLGQLPEGIYWLVTSGDPRGAEKLSGATMTRTFSITPRSHCVHCDTSCDLGRDDARFLPSSGFPRWLAIDGIATRGAQNRARHRMGLLIGLAALGVAALLEVLLLTAASREARRILERAEDEAEGRPFDNTAPKTTAKSPGGNLLVALLVALLGFAFLAALIIAKA